MKRIKNKGFTMIELLGVITLLGIIAIICIPSVSKLLKNVGNSYYKAIEKNVKSAGTDYYTDNKDLLPDDVGKTSIVYVGDKTNSKNSLVGLSYIEDVVDRNKNTCGYYGETKLYENKKEEYSYVIVNREYKDAKREETKYTYTSCMHCLGDNYNTNEEENQYCKSSYKPENNRYIKAPVNYYLQISEDDYKTNELRKVPENKSSYTSFEIRKAGIRDNDGKQLIDEENKAITIPPSKIELIIDGKKEKGFSSVKKDEVWESLNTTMSSKIGTNTWKSYLEKHTVKLKLIYRYEYKYIEAGKEETGTREAETYITLIKAVTEEAKPVTIEINYQDQSGIYYKSTPIQTETGGYIADAYNYVYNVNHDNVDSKYQSLVKNTIIGEEENLQEYKKAEDIAWINRGVTVAFSSTGATAFECSYDKKEWYPCESKESYDYTMNQDIYVRGINMFGSRGTINVFPIKIDKEDVITKTSIDEITGENKWYVKDVTMKGKTTQTESKIQYTKVCTTTKESCDPLIEASENTNTELDFTKKHTEETRGITYCYKAINNAGSISETVCHFIKLDKTKPVCQQDACENSLAKWVNTNKTITCKGEDPNPTYNSGLNTQYSKKSVTYSTDIKTSKIEYTLKDNAGNKTSCSKDVDVYVDKTVPTVPTVSLSKTGWTTEDVDAVASGATDNLSGINHYEYSVNDNNSIEGTTYTFTTPDNTEMRSNIKFRVQDNAGNYSYWSSKEFAYIDRKAPSCTTVSSANANGWTNRNVTVTGICTDGGSGCKNANPTTIIYANYNKIESVSPGYVYDNLGHVTYCKSIDVKIDIDPPTCGSCSGGSTTWTNADRTITCTGSDSYSGIEGSTVKTYNKTKKVDTVYYTVRDLAGNSLDCQQNMNIYVDKTLPSCGSCSGQSTTWTKGSRTITCTGSDSDSGLASGNTGKSKTYNSGTTKKGEITYTVKDNAGNKKSCTKAPNVYVDKTPPTISGITLFNHDTCSNSSGVSAKYTVSDDGGSGVAHVEDYWGTNNENFKSSFIGHAVNRGTNTNITSAYGTACYSAGSPATKGANYYIKIYAKDSVGNELFYHTGTAQANG